jgi:hypothetical protein
VLPKRIENWSLTNLQQRLVKTGGRLVKHARYYWLMLAESRLTRRSFGSMVRRIGALATELTEAVDAAKTGGQDVGGGDVFVKVTEKKQLPYLGFSRRGGIRVWWGQDTAPGGKRSQTLQFGDQEFGVL